MYGHSQDIDGLRSALRQSVPDDQEAILLRVKEEAGLEYEQSKQKSEPLDETIELEIFKVQIQEKRHGELSVRTCRSSMVRRLCQIAWKLEDGAQLDGPAIPKLNRSKGCEKRKQCECVNTVAKQQKRKLCVHEQERCHALNCLSGPRRRSTSDLLVEHRDR